MIRDRHAAQARFAPFGADAQDRLAKAHVLVVGVGALGSHVAATLARAGVGRMTLIDRDVVDVGNLHRQILFDLADAEAGTPKADAAAAAITRIDPELHVTPIAAHFDAALWRQLAAHWGQGDRGDDDRPQLLIDGTDNFATRYVLNDLADAEGLPWVHGAVLGAEGRAMVVRPGLTPCLRCLLPEPPPAGSLPTCETAGVLAPAVAQIAAFQALEAMKLLGGREADVVRGMFVADCWHGRYDVLFAEATPRADCPTCGRGERPALLTGDGDDLLSLCGRDAVQVRPGGVAPLDLATFAAGLAAVPGLTVTATPRMVRLQGSDWRMSVFEDARALVFGTGGDQARARTLYDRYVGH